MRKMIFTVLIFSLMTNINVFAQDYIGISLNMGVGYVATQYGANDPTWEITPKPSWQLGVLYEKELTEKSVLESGLLITRIKDKGTMTFVNISANEDWRYDFTNTSVSFGVPLKYVYRTPIMSLRGGLLVTFNVLEKFRSESITINHSTGESYNSGFYSGNRYFSGQLDYGLIGGVSVKLSNAVCLDLDYFHGLKDLRNNNTANRSTRRLSLGFRLNRSKF